VRKINRALFGARVLKLTAEMRDLQHRVTAIESRFSALESRVTALKVSVVRVSETTGEAK